MNHTCPYARIACGDCGATGPEWASLNRGILLCNDCCFVHRSLGPQLSKVKALRDTDWNPRLRKMVMTLAAGPANHVWEHSMFDRTKGDKDTSVKKPVSSDSLEVKRKFILLKHKQFHFVPRTSPDQVEAKSQELHSTVRTGAIETTLRLLAGGADPNYFHPEKGTRPLHVAALNGQFLQVELLTLHGAIAGAADYLGQTAYEHALVAGIKELALRILQLRYILTDQLSMYACGQRPDHSTSKHIVVPTKKGKTSLEQEEKICHLPIHLLEQVAADLYDEVDRRLLEKLVKSKLGNDSSKFSIAFLPVNSHYPPVRNQARQKYARLTENELCALIALVILECEKRHWKGEGKGADLKEIFSSEKWERFVNDTRKVPPPVPSKPVSPQTSAALEIDDDYPLYDSVASDEDLILVDEKTIPFVQQAKDSTDGEISGEVSLPIDTDDKRARSSSTLFKENMLWTKLMETESQLNTVLSENRVLVDEIKVLDNMVKHCITENLKLFDQMNEMFRKVTKCNSDSCYTHNPPEAQGKCGRKRQPVDKSRPISMVELTTAETIRGEPQKDGSVFKPTVTMTTEEIKRNGLLMEINPLAQRTTGKLVDLIKIMVDSSMSNDIPTVSKTTKEIYKVVYDMTYEMMAKAEVKIRPDVMDKLHGLMYSAVKLHEGIPAICAATPPLSKNLVSTVRQLCFDLGAALKEFAILMTKIFNEEKAFILTHASEVHAHATSN